MATRTSTEWLTRYIGIQKRYDAKILARLQAVRAQLERELQQLSDRDNISSVIRRAQLVGALSSLWRGIETIVKDGYGEAQATALSMSFDWDDVLLKVAFPKASERAAMKRSLLETADRNVESLFARVFQSYIPLSAKVYNVETLANGWLDRIVDSGIASGEGARSIANKVIDFVNPNTPGGAKYAALRLGRTEINNAYHAQSIDVNSDKPWNKGMKWRKSDSHKIPDLCDEYHNRIFPIGEVPPKPHPQCLCTVFPEVVDIDTFMRNLHAGEYNKWLEEKLGVNGVSPNMYRAG